MTKKKIMINQILDDAESLAFKVSEYRKLYQKSISCKLVSFNKVMKGIKIYDDRKKY